LGDAVVMQGPWRLLKNRLYNVHEDLEQSTDVSKEHPEIHKKLVAAYEEWLKVTEPEYKKKRYIDLGHPRALTTMLYSCDWQGDFCDNPIHLTQSHYFGAWDVSVVKAGTYRIELSRWPFESGKALTEGLYRINPNWAATDKKRTMGIVPIASATLEVAGVTTKAKAKPGDKNVTFEVELPEGNHQLKTIFHDASGKDLCSANYVRVTLIK